MSKEKTLAYEKELLDKLVVIENEKKMLQKQIEFIQNDADLARRTVSEYAEEVATIQRTMNAFIQSIEMICTQGRLSFEKRENAILKEVRLVQGVEGKSYLQSKGGWMNNGRYK